MKHVLQPSLLLITVTALISVSSEAAVPQLINYQGRLTNGVGAPLDTTVTLLFTVCSDSLGVTSLWSEIHPGVVIKDGLFQVLLGSVTPLSESVFNGSKRWLGVQLQGGIAPTALIPIVSVAYAYRAAKSDTAGYALFGSSSSGGGWTDDGVAVRLTTITDNVGIGTSSPGSRLEVRNSGSTGLACLIRNDNQANSEQALWVETSGNGAAVFGSSPFKYGLHGMSANSYGVYGTGSRGVYGFHIDSRHYGYLGSGSYGVYGKDSTTGVWGAIGGGNAGVVGVGQGSSQVGIFGENGGAGVGIRGSSIDSSGVYGSSANKYGVSGTGSKGVFGLHLGTNHYGYLGSSNYGVFGKDSTTGVWGAIGGGNAGVYGEGNNTSTFGLFGYNSGGGIGIRGSSIDSTGVYGSSASKYGVYGTGSKAVFGLHPGTNHYGYLGSQNYGVFGKDSTTGVWGAIGGGNAAVVGVGQGISQVGIFGENSSGGVGIRGSSVDSCGIYGSSAIGIGVLGTGKKGLYGLHPTSGNYGHLGSPEYGAYGEYDGDGSYGYLGGLRTGVKGYSLNGTGVWGLVEGTGAVAVAAQSNFGTGLDAYSFSGSAIHALGAAGGGALAGHFEGPVQINCNPGSNCDSTMLRLKGKAVFSLNDGELALRTDDQGDPGRYRLKFDNNNLGVICGSDYADQVFTFMSTWGANRKYDAHLKVHGSATGTGSWGKYIELYHDGTDGFITTDAGHIIMSPASYVGVGTSTPAYKLDVAGSCHASSFPTSSDLRLKTDIQPLTGALDKISKIRGVSFSWNELYETMGRSTGHREIGVVAQDVEEVLPELVTKWGDDDYRAVDYGRLTAVLIEAVKELKTENKALKQRLEVLESKK
jgi:hypothetical protein